MAVDPIEAMLAEQIATDHGRAALRGVRLKALADALITELVGQAILPTARIDDARVAMFSILADDIYGIAAVDIPSLRGERQP